MDEGESAIEKTVDGGGGLRGWDSMTLGAKIIRFCVNLPSQYKTFTLVENGFESEKIYFTCRSDTG